MPKKKQTAKQWLIEQMKKGFKYSANTVRTIMNGKEVGMSEEELKKRKERGEIK